MLATVPTINMRDIMSHEAHRHPFIEAMGTIYLLKLRYGKAFCSNAGSCWRLLFVYSLMPWMQRYRIFDAPGLARFDEFGNVILTDDEAHLAMKDMNVSSKSRLKVAPRSLQDVQKESKDKVILGLRNENEELRAALAKLEEKLKKKKKKKKSSSGAKNTDSGEASGDSDDFEE